jgi:hypothetical protein
MESLKIYISSEMKPSFIGKKSFKLISSCHSGVSKTVHRVQHASYNQVAVAQASTLDVLLVGANSNLF